MLKSLEKESEQSYSTQTHELNRMKYENKTKK